MSKDHLIEVRTVDDYDIALPTSKIHLIKKSYGDGSAEIIGNFKYHDYEIDGIINTITPYEEVVAMYNGKTIETEVKTVLKHVALGPMDMQTREHTFNQRDVNDHRLHIERLEADGWTVMDSREEPVSSTISHKFSHSIVTDLKRNVIKESK